MLTLAIATRRSEGDDAWMDGAGRNIIRSFENIPRLLGARGGQTCELNFSPLFVQRSRQHFFVVAVISVPLL